MAGASPATSSKRTRTSDSRSKRFAFPRVIPASGPPGDIMLAARLEIHAHAPRITTHGSRESRAWSTTDWWSVRALTCTPLSRSRGSKVGSSMSGKVVSNAVTDVPAMACAFAK